MRRETEQPVRKPLNEFGEHSIEWMEQVRQTRRPLMLTADNEPSIVLQDAASYRELVERLEALEMIHDVHVGIDDLAAGRTVPMEEALEQLRTEFDLHR